MAKRAPQDDRGDRDLHVDQYHTTTDGLDDRYRGVHNGRRVTFVPPEGRSGYAR